MDLVEDKELQKWELKVPKKRKRPILNSKSGESFKKKKESSHKLPTAEELDELRNAETTFHSSLFRMQVEELMKEMKAKINGKDKLIKWLEQFTSYLSSLPESDTYSVNDMSWKSNKVKFPITRHPKETKGLFKFVAPTDIKEIGSFAQNTICASDPIVDIALEVPKAFWQQMDFVNHRYHRKRALYLTYIAQCLLESDLVLNLRFAYHQNSYLKPVLLIKPKALGKGRIPFTISVTAYPEKSSFKFSRFIPERNNVRQSWYFNEEKDLDVPTPHYNATILADLLLPDINEYLKENISSESLVEGIILLKVWCIQRGLISQCGKFSGFFITMYVTYLLKQKKINPMMSSYQIFRCTLLALQNEDLIHTGITLCDKTHANQPNISEFLQLCNVVFVDPSGFLNICFNTSKEDFLALQHEARLGMEILNESFNKAFDLLFMTQITFHEKFEHMLHLSGHKKFKKYCEKLKLEEKMLDYGEDIVTTTASKICDILRDGFKSRISLIDVKFSSCHQWSVSNAPHNPNLGEVIIGILLNPEVPPSNLEKGPLSEDPKVKEFLDFWGEKSEMRRFKDGTICETVYWPAETVEDKRIVFCSMLKYILEKHVGIHPESIHLTGLETNFLLNVPEALIPFGSPSFGTGEEEHMSIMKSFTSLTKQMQCLEGLPLTISSIQGTSPIFRFSETFPPLPILHGPLKHISYARNNALNLIEVSWTAPPYIPALNAIITFEGSGKWPDDADVIKRMKAAFYIKLASLIYSQKSITAVPLPNHIDIYKDGYVFRFEIASHKEVYLLKQTKLPNGMIKIRDTEESQALERSAFILPKLNGILHGLHQQHNTYGTACRLAKRWLSSQLLHCYLHNVTVELLMASIYVDCVPYTCPSLPQVAFVRFLYLLHTHDWKISPLIINFNSEFTKNDIEEMNSTFTNERFTYPPMTIITPLDRKGAMWTKKMPQNVILKRLITLAKASSDTLKIQLLSKKQSDIKEIFRPPHDAYDAMIRLKDSLIPQRCLAIDFLGHLPQRFKPYKWHRNEKYPIVEYNPIELYLKELRENFDELALFFYDAYGGDYIAVVFKPSAFTASKFTVSHANSCQTIENVEDNGDVTVKPNIKAILQEFQTLGSTFVKHVQILNDKLNCT